MCVRTNGPEGDRIFLRKGSFARSIQPRKGGKDAFFPSKEIYLIFWGGIGRS